MKHFKKILVLALSAIMIFSLSACGGSGDATYPEETLKVAVCTFDTAGNQFIAMQDYLDYLAEGLNIEVTYSESLKNATQELDFIESSAAAGCKLVIGYYNIARAQSIQLAIDKGMYYFGVAEEDAVYEQFKDDPMYLGGVYNPTADYDSGYAMGKALADAGCKKVVYASGGKDFGIQMFIDRYDGFMAAINEAGGIEVVEVAGWPDAASFAAKQAAALSTPGLDGVASSTGISNWITPIDSAGLSDKIKLAGIDVLDGSYTDLFESGQAVCNVAEPTESFVAAIPMVINAINDDGDVNRENGLASRLLVNRWIITNGEDYAKYLELENGGDYAVNVDEVKSCIKALNPDATYENTFKSIYGDLSISAIEARRK